MEPGHPEERDDSFTDKIARVRRVLVGGEGFVDAEVVYDQEAKVVFFRAPGASSFKLRRDEFDRRSDCEVAFFVSTRMRRPLVIGTKPTAKRMP